MAVFKNIEDRAGEATGLMYRVKHEKSKWGVSSYEELTDKPLINGVIVLGELSLDDLNIQPKGDYITREEYKVNNIALENGLGINSLQQCFEADSWNTTNELVKKYIEKNIANGDGQIIDYEVLDDGNYSVKVITNGKSAFNQNGKSQTVGGKSHAEGSKNIAFESNAHAEGNETFAAGKHSHSEGNTTTAAGNASHAEGYKTHAAGIASHTEGSETEALGDFGHAEGALTHANGPYTHAEGLETMTTGVAAHAEGGHTEATEDCAHAEGYTTHAIGQYSHAEGCETIAEGGNAHAEGRGSHAEGWESHAEGGNTYAAGGTSHAEGDTTIAIGGASHAEGYHTVATANHSHVEGRYNEIDEDGNYVHIVGNGYYDEVNQKEVRSNAHTIDWSGNGVYAGTLKINKNKEVATKEECEAISSLVKTMNIENGSGENSLQQKKEMETWTTTNEHVHDYLANQKGLEDDPNIKIKGTEWEVEIGAFGESSTMLHGKSQALGNKTHAEGSKTIAFENNSHAEGCETFAAGKHSHAEGLTTTATGNASHSEGNLTLASGQNAHAEGAYTKATGVSSHAEGHKTEANNDYTHAEGFYSQANGPYSHAEGHKTFANGYYSHSEGNDTHAIGGASHAEGQGTYADGNFSVVMGKYNARDVYENTETPTQQYAVIVGNGDSNDKRSNAYTLDWKGNGIYTGGLKINKNQEVAVKNTNNNFTAAQTINGTLTINGDIVQNGQVYETHAEKLYTKNDEIITRDGATGGLGSNEYTGIIAKKYDGTNDGRLGFNANGEARVGDIGDEQPLLTRDETTNLTNGQVLTWDGDSLKAIGSDDFIKNTDYVTSAQAGIVKIGSGLGIWTNASNQLHIAKASEAEIDAKTNNYKPIVPSNLEYAVKSIGDGYYVKNDEYATKTTAGVVKASEGGGIGASSTGNLFIIPATNEDIDAKTNTFKPIVSSNLDYAVKSIGDGYYIKNDEYATTSTVGVVKANGSGGITVNSAGNISVVKATDDDIDTQTNAYKAIVPANLDYAVKSVGDGYYTKTTDYATSAVAGVMRPANGLRMSGTTGAVVISKASDVQIDAKTDNYYPIVPANLNYAVGSVRASETQFGSVKVWVSTNENGEIGLNISTEA